jgi:hypothetical protein
MTLRIVLLTSAVFAGLYYGILQKLMKLFAILLLAGAHALGG